MITFESDNISAIQGNPKAATLIKDSIRKHYGISTQATLKVRIRRGKIKVSCSDKIRRKILRGNEMFEVNL